MAKLFRDLTGVQIWLEGDLWGHFLRRLEVAAENTRHEQEETKKREANLEDYIELERMAASPSQTVTPPDIFESLFTGNHPLYADLMDRKMVCPEVVTHLWDFSKVPEMVLHEWGHVEHVYRIAAALVKELADAQLLQPLNPVELYILAGAALLHDVGLSGGSVEDENHQLIPIGDYSDVRRLHGCIACYELRQDIGEELQLPPWAKRSIGYVSCYHQRKAPLYDGKPSWDEWLDKMQTRKSKVNPIEERQFHRVDGSDHTVRTRLLAALLRLADVLDVDKDRAGDRQHHPVIRLKVQDEIDLALFRTRDAGGKLDGRLVGQIRNIWIHADPETIKKCLEGIANQSGQSDQAKSALAYLAYLCWQPEHFRKHQCFEEVQVALERQNDGWDLVARYPKIGGDYDLVERALKLVRQDVEEEFGFIKDIPPFNRLARVRVELA